MIATSWHRPQNTQIPIQSPIPSTSLRPLISFTPPALEAVSHGLVRQNSIASTSTIIPEESLGVLANGWEQRFTPEGRPYFVDHVITTFSFKSFNSRTHARPLG